MPRRRGVQSRIVSAKGTLCLRERPVRLHVLLVHANGQRSSARAAIHARNRCASFFASDTVVSRASRSVARYSAIVAAPCNLCRVSRAWITPLALVLGLCGTLARGARAQAQADADISWRAPAGCPASNTVRDRVRSLLAGNDERAPTLRARGEIESSGSEYVLSLVVDVEGHRAQRSLRGNDCAALTDAGAWLIALAVDPRLMEKQPQPELQEPAEEPPAEEPQQAEPEDEAEPGESLARRMGLRAGVLGGVYQAGLPAPQASLGVRAGGSAGPLYVELAAAHLFARELDLTLGAEGSLASQFLRFRGCVEWGDRLRAGPCGAITLLRTAGELSSGAQRSSPGQALWLSAGLSAQAGYVLWAPLEALVDAGLDLAVSPRPRFEVQGLGTVATARFVSVHTTLGLGVRY